MELIKELMTLEEAMQKPFPYQGMSDYLTVSRDWAKTVKGAQKTSQKDIKSMIETDQFSPEELEELDKYLAANEDKWSALTAALDYNKKSVAGVPKEMFKLFLTMFKEM
jgi:hypothetical protein